MHKTLLNAVVVLILLSPMRLMAQSDAELFSQGRIAFDKYHDCPAAEKALSAVSVAARNDPTWGPVWMSYMARTEECLGNLQQAIIYWEQYDQKKPGQADVINSLADLRYRLQKQQEAEAKKAADEASARAVAEARQAAIDRAAEQRRQQKEAEAQKLAEFRADALRTLSSDSNELVSLVNRVPGDYWKLFRVSAPTNCQLQIEEKTKGTYLHEFYTLDLGNVESAVAVTLDDGAGAAIVRCQPDSFCISVSDESHAAFEHHIPDNRPRTGNQYNFLTVEYARSAANLFNRIAAACRKP